MQDIKNPNIQALNLKDYVLKNSAAIFLIVLLLINITFTPNFLKINTIWNILIQATPIILLAMSMTFVISSGGIDISVGSIMAISSIVIVKLLPVAGLTMAIIIGVIVGTVVGSFNGFLISVFKIQPTIITLAMMIAGRGIARVIANGYILRYDSPGLVDLAMKRFAGIPIQFFYLIVVSIIFIFLSKYTTFSRKIEAIGDNPKAAKLSGINVTAIIISVYALSGFMSSFAGILTIARAGAADPDSIGTTLEMSAIASVAIGDTKMTGGKAKIAGSLIGALIMQLITVTFNMNNIPYDWSLVAKTFIIILAVFLQNIKEA